MDNMLSNALRTEFESGPLHHLLVNLGGKNHELWNDQFNRFLRQELCWEKFKIVGCVNIPERASTFVVKNNFVVNHVGPAKIGYIGGEDFIRCEEKVEKPEKAKVLGCFNLAKKEMYYEDIVSEFGGENKVETTFADIFLLMERYSGFTFDKKTLLGRGEPGNIFFVRDQSNILRVIEVSSIYRDFHTLGYYFSVITHKVNRKGALYNLCFQDNQIFVPLTLL